MPGELYDTCVFIDYWRGDPGALVLINNVIQGKASASYSTLSATELWQYSKLSRQEEIEYTALIQFLQEAVLTTTIAVQAGQWLRLLSRSQRMRLTADALIAATAKARGERIRTRNYRDIIKFYSSVQSY